MHYQFQWFYLEQVWLNQKANRNTAILESTMFYVIVLPFKKMKTCKYLVYFKNQLLEQYYINITFTISISLLLRLLFPAWPARHSTLIWSNISLVAWVNFINVNLRQFFQNWCLLIKKLFFLDIWQGSEYTP